MTDVRAMLRAERATRGPEPVGKKRKAAGISTSSPAESRKRVKSGDEQPQASAKPTEENTVAELEVEATSTPVAPPEPEPQVEPEPTEADLLAFDRELADLEAEHKFSSTTTQHPTYTGATISAAPLTAEQIAAQAREEQSQQRGKRDEEIEAEREDAEENLREEMEEMRGLEERVRRLRERREAVRGREISGERGDGEGSGVVSGVVEGVGGDDDEEENVDGEDHEEEEVDEWRFGGS
ncbi:hypothetical protein LTR86_000063 [Recurvomyces mirabilis]|nr:hypothetical protein LTR86_000063 [Recurvomyces mirabilis]